MTVLFMSVLMSGCKNDAGIKDADKIKTGSQKSSYSTRGFVLELIPDDKSAFIHHEVIPGFMEEMTMYLKVEDPEEYSELKAGHQYKFDMIVNKEDGTYIKNIIPTGEVKAGPLSGSKPSEKWFKKPTFELGDKLPEFSLKTSDGKIINSSKLSGGPWAI
ncbi:MAG: copper-binding protein, partial [Verrucomicrobiales bacterium]|nr:copper-binding protein [Verrucomicrobiales bacterium]